MRHTIFRIIVLILWVSFFLYLIISGESIKYLHPSLRWILIAGALAMTGMILSLAFSLKKSPVSCEIHCECHTHEKESISLRQEIQQILFIIFPISLVFLIPLSKGLSATMSGGVFSENFENELKNVSKKNQRNHINGLEEYTVAEILSFGTSVSNRIAVQGMVYQSSELMPPDFYLVRYYITCCSADARLLSLRIDAHNLVKQVKIKNNQWIIVTGTVRVDNKKLFLHADTLQIVERPENEYLY